MARNGSGVYSLPGTYLAVSGETIEAQQHNDPLEDLASDANTPRPVVAGGTGQSTASLPDTWTVHDPGDSTKKARLDAGNVTAGQTRIITVADRNVNLAEPLMSGSDIASAATLDLDAATGTIIDVTGTTTITAVTLTAGRTRIVRAAGAFLITAGSSLIVNGSTSINYTTTAGDLLFFEGYGSSVVRVWLIGQGTGTAPIITPWTSYTPTFTGFGTAASVSMWWRRVGDSCDIRGHFTTGTTTSTEARISLPNSIVTDATKVNAVQQVHGGYMAQTSASAAYIIPLIESNVGYLTFGAQNSTQAGLTKETGAGAFSSSRKYSIAAYGIPISGW